MTSDNKSKKEESPEEVVSKKEDAEVAAIK